MKITIAGSLGNIGRPLAEILIASGHDITVISNNLERKTDIEGLGAKAAIGSVTDAVFLTEAFKGADAVYTMTPPNIGGANVIANTNIAGEAFAKAIKASGVDRVVMLSSIGADLSNGTGPIVGLYAIEQLYNNLENVAITYLRAGLFYINFYNDIPLIKGMGVLGGNYPGDIQIPVVHPNDIAVAAAEELQKASTGKQVRYIVSDIRKPGDFAKVLGTAIDKPDLSWVEFTDQQSLEGMTQAGLPEEIANLYTEMGTGFRNGKIPADFQRNGSPVTGKIKLEEFASEFALKY